MPHIIAGLVVIGLSICWIALATNPSKAGLINKPKPPVVYEYPEFNTVCFVKYDAISCVKVKRGDNP